MNKLAFTLGFEKVAKGAEQLNKINQKQPVVQQPKKQQPISLPQQQVKQSPKNHISIENILPPTKDLTIPHSPKMQETTLKYPSDNPPPVPQDYPFNVPPEYQPDISLGNILQAEPEQPPLPPQEPTRAIPESLATNTDVTKPINYINEKYKTGLTMQQLKDAITYYRENPEKHRGFNVYNGLQTKSEYPRNWGPFLIPAGKQDEPLINRWVMPSF